MLVADRAQSPHTDCQSDVRVVAGPGGLGVLLCNDCDRPTQRTQTTA